jgi:hypothetical protein
MSCVTADNSENNKAARTNQAPSAADVAQTKRELTLELLNESLGFARVYAELAQGFSAVGDDQGTLYALRNFRHAARAACSCGAELRALREAAAS